MKANATIIQKEAARMIRCLLVKLRCDGCVICFIIDHRRTLSSHIPAAVAAVTPIAAAVGIRPVEVAVEVAAGLTASR